MPRPSLAPLFWPLPGYEFRGNRWTWPNIYGALVNKGHALVEAGTGVGKSLAYLVP